MTWEKVKLGDVCNTTSGGTPSRKKADYYGGTIPWVKSGELEQKPVLKTSEFLTEVGVQNSSAKIQPVGTVLLALYGATIGKCSILGIEAATNQAICCIRVKEKITNDFLLAFLRYKVRDIINLGVGGAQPNISQQIVREIEIPLPPLAEQKRLAAILDRADELRRARRSTLARLDELAQSLFLELFGDPATNPKGWDVVRLGEAVQFRTGKLDSNAAVIDGDYPFFTCSREDFRINEYAFDCEALLLAGNNASADYSVKHYKGKFNAYQRTYVIELLDSKNSYDYMRHVLERKLLEMKRMSKGTNTKYLTLGILKNLSILMPPFALQQQFAEQMAELEIIKTRARASLVELDALFASLQARAFSGELSGVA